MPYFYDGDLKTVIAKRKLDRYRLALENTLKVLLERNLPTLHYDIHAPIVFEKDKFQKIMSQYDWTVQHGYVIKSLYVNSLQTI